MLCGLVRMDNVVVFLLCVATNSLEKAKSGAPDSASAPAASCGSCSFRHVIVFLLRAANSLSLRFIQYLVLIIGFEMPKYKHERSEKRSRERDARNLSRVPAYQASSDATSIEVSSLCALPPPHHN